MLIRAATEAELPGLREIERSAGTPFAAIGMARIAEDEPPSLAELRGHLDADRLRVAVLEQAPVAYLLAEEVDGDAHVAQVSVHAGYFRRGIGRALIEHLATDARRRGLPALSLTTFRDVPWNGPYYRRLGFRDLAGDEITPGLAAIRAHEAALGLDEWPRCCMRQVLAH